MAPFSVTSTGIIAYRSSAADTQLTWFDRSGQRLATLGAPDRYNSVEPAPDEQRVAVERLEPRGREPNIWLLSQDGDAPTQFTFAGAIRPNWSRDGQYLSFIRESNIDRLTRKSVAGNGKEEVLYQAPADMYLTCLDWSPDGGALVVREVPRSGSSFIGSLFLLQLNGRAPTLIPIPQTESRGMNPRFSPNGHWLAYTTEESGVPEVYVQPYPTTGAKWLVSHGGGVRPRWRADGRELFYIASTVLNGAGRLMAAPVEETPTFRVRPAAALFDIPFTPTLANDYPYGVSRDGQRILVIVSQETLWRSPVTVVLNWTAELKRN